MKAILGVILVGMMAFGMIGCPATTGNFVIDSRNQLEIYDLVETALYTGFQDLCVSGEIPMDTCAIVSAADLAWDTAYNAAKIGLEQYETGKITKEQAQALVTSAVKIYLQIKADLKKNNKAPLEKRMGEKGIKLAPKPLSAPPAKK